MRARTHSTLGLQLHQEAPNSGLNLKKLPVKHVRCAAEGMQQGMPSGARPRRSPLLLLIAAVVAASPARGQAPGDSLRVNAPRVPFALEPLRWGAVTPRGWLREWATALSRGSGSPKCSAFAVTKVNGHSVDGWKDGRPSFGGFWDEDSAYYVDGTALGVAQNPGNWCHGARHAQAELHHTGCREPRAGQFRMPQAARDRTGGHLTRVPAPRGG